MGRKIPAKKHRGVKDPLVQQAKRLESLKNKINTPPKDPDEQPIPRSLIRLFGLEDPKKKDNKKKKNHTKFKPGTSKKDLHDTNKKSNNPVSKLRKLPGESGRSFSLRINSAIKTLSGPEEDLHYPEDLEAEDYKGQRMMEQRERRAKKRQRAERAAKKNGADSGEQASDQHLTRTQKLALKKKAKKLKALESASEKSEVLYERVQFGEVCHAPPALVPPRRHQPGQEGAARPGRRELLLSSMLKGAPPPPAEVARRERARLDAVAAYRQLKANKHKENIKNK